MGYPEPIQPGLTRIGWIGTGVMGGAMAARLLSAGYHLTVYARTPSSAAHLLPLGAALASSPSAAALSSDVIFTILSHPSDVRSVALSLALPSLPPSSVLVDMTSSSPALARSLHSAARARSCYAVDAPVSGGDVGARDGTLAILAGGDAAIVSWLSPLFAILGTVTHLGPAGSGQSAKIGNQIAASGCLLGLSEAMVFARAEGLDERRFLEAVRGGSARSRSMELFGERIIGRDFRPGGLAEYMLKDLGMGFGIGCEGGDGDEGEEEGMGTAGVVLPGAALCKQLFVGMVAQGNGKMGLQGLITAIERLNGKDAGDEQA